MRGVAIYDLDRTLLSRATYTPFLAHAAARRAPWRLALMPVWVGAMAGYKAGFGSRGALKDFGLRLFLSGADEKDLGELATSFRDRVLPDWLGDGARSALERDRAEGRVLVLATAAMAFYAGDIGKALGFDHVVATRHRLDAGQVRIEGENCYGPAKVGRIEALFRDAGLDRGDCHVRFYSDSVSDAPLLDWSDDAVLIDQPARVAAARGWRAMRFSGQVGTD